MFLGVILFTQFITVFTQGIVPLHDGCAQGEPLVGENQPDVNITVLPSIFLPTLSPFAIVCDADIPRFPSNSAPDPPLPPVTITIHVGVYKVRECTGNPINRCNYSLASFFPGLPRRVSCTAQNIQGQCRFKIVAIELLPLAEDTTTSQPRLNTTATPNTTTDSQPFPSGSTVNGTNVTTTASTSQGNLTTAIPVGNVSTTASTSQVNITTAAPVGNVSTTEGTSQENLTTSTPVSNGASLEDMKDFVKPLTSRKPDELVNLPTKIEEESSNTDISGLLVRNDHRNFAVKSFPGATLEDIKDFDKPLTKRKANKLILRVGTNNLRNPSPREFADAIVNLAAKIKEESSNRDVGISGLLVKYDNNDFAGEDTTTRTPVSTTESVAPPLPTTITNTGQDEDEDEDSDDSESEDSDSDDD